MVLSLDGLLLTESSRVFLDDVSHTLSLRRFYVLVAYWKELKVTLM